MNPISWRTKYRRAVKNHPGHGTHDDQLNEFVADLWDMRDTGDITDLDGDMQHIFRAYWRHKAGTAAGRLRGQFITAMIDGGGIQAAFDMGTDWDEVVKVCSARALNSHYSGRAIYRQGTTKLLSALDAEDIQLMRLDYELKRRDMDDWWGKAEPLLVELAEAAAPFRDLSSWWKWKTQAIA